MIVRAPLDTSPERIAHEIETRKRQILQKIEHNQKYPFQRQIKEFVSGESLLYLGRPYKLHVVDEPFDGVLFDSKFFLSKANQKVAGYLLKNWYIGQASEIIVPKAVSIAKQIGVEFNKINIMDLKYRWDHARLKVTSILIGV